MLEAVNNTYNSYKELKILNFYGDTCPPCHSFMPIFINAEERYKNYMDFIVVNCGKNIELSNQFWVRSTPTVIVLKWEEIVYNKPWVPNWAELKQLLVQLIWKDVSSEVVETKKKKKFFWLFW